MIKVAEKFEELSKDIWAKIPVAHHHNIQYGEETITDLMLLEIATKNLFNIKIIQTPKKLEAKQGTDWEWYIGSNKFGWIRFVIQAKKLHVKSNNYESLNHSIAKGGARQQLLIRNYAMSKNAIPLYNFYNHNAAANASHWQCNKAYKKELLGWTFTPLLNVEATTSIPIGKRRRATGWCSFDTIQSFKETLPIRCLFSCPIFLSIYTNTSTIGKQEYFLGESFIKTASLPANLVRKLQQVGAQDILSFTEAELTHYLNEKSDSRVNDNNPIDINSGFYPKRIAIIDIGDITGF